MSLASEISKIAGFFRKTSAPRFYKNEFINPSLKLSDFPAITAAMDEALPTGFVPEDRKPGYSVAISPGTFEVQWHQTSVGEHTDDVKPGWFYQVFVLRAITEVDTAYGTTTKFTAFGDGGRKVVAELQFGESVIFAPNRKHSLTYFGDAVIVALRSVRKIKK